jgi:hypothetical protein
VFAAQLVLLAPEPGLFLEFGACTFGAFAAEPFKAAV